MDYFGDGSRFDVNIEYLIDQLNIFRNIGAIDLSFTPRQDQQIIKGQSIRFFSEYDEDTEVRFDL